MNFATKNEAAGIKCVLKGVFVTCVHIYDTCNAIKYNQDVDLEIATFNLGNMIQNIIDETNDELNNV